MTNPFDIIKNLFLKRPLPDDLNMSTVLFLNKWIGLTEYHGYVRNLVEYTTYIEPIHYVWLLYLTLPRTKPPYIKPLKKRKVDDRLERVRSVLGWSQSELLKNKRVVSKLLTIEGNKILQDMG